ncbi:YfhO family protein [Propionibacteriaceae bacterium G1746]|uniref:YfhO family protein n=1 Tax=Aestuariimicrobium sp. G57 TaxID=3418485 RepID=UPI003C15423D
MRPAVEQVDRFVGNLVDRLPPRLAAVTRKPVVGQVIRFGIVGVTNTLVYYAFYRLLLLALPYLGAHLIAWALSVVFSFFANCWFTYRVRPTWRRFIAFPATTLVNVAFTTFGSVILVSLFSADVRYVTLAMGILAIPFTFLVTRMVLVGRPEDAPQRDWRTWVRGAAAPVTAALGAISANVLVARALGLTPFGEVGRGIGDYGPQYLPFHLYLHDVLTNNTDGSIADLGNVAFTWAGAGGTGFLPEYATYLGGPFTLLVGFFPLRLMDVAILVVSLVRIGCAAAAMMALLQVLRPRAPRLAGICLSIGYATSSWVVQLGMTTPQWLDGLLAFPLMCLAAVLTVRHRAVVAPVALVALGWWSNYYSAMMASLGAAFFALAWLVAEGRRPVAVLRGLVGFAVRGGLGVGTAMWLLWPSLVAVGRASFAPSTLMRVEPNEMTLRLFGFTAGVDFPPMLFAGSLVLICAAAVALAPALGWRARITWAALAVVAVVSLQWKIAIQLFNGGDVPNGNAYRWSFIVVGLLVVAGWHALTERADGREDARGWLTRAQLVVALVVVSLLVWHASGVTDLEHVTYSAWWLGPYAAIAALFAYTFVARVPRPRRQAVRAVAQVVIVCCVVVELVWSGVIITPHSRYQYGVSEPYVLTSAAERQAAAKTVETSQWPTYRVGSPVGHDLPRWNVPNLPLRMHLPGTAMYTSTMPAQVQETMRQLGYPAGSRRVQDQPGLLNDVVLSVAARWDEEHQVVAVQPALPMVRVVGSPRPQVDPANPPRGQERVVHLQSLFTRPVVSAPVTSLAWQDGNPAEVTSGSFVASRKDQVLVLTATCERGTLSFRTPNLAGKATWVNTATDEKLYPSQGQFIDDLAGTGQTARLRYVSRDAGYTELGLALCVDYQQLMDEINQTPVPQISVDGARITARFAGPQTGDAVLAVANQPGWSCSTDGRGTRHVERAGLIAVPMNGAEEVSCVYRQPGVGVGVGASLLSLLATVALTVLAARRPAAQRKPQQGTPVEGA